MATKKQQPAGGITFPAGTSDLLKTFARNVRAVREKKNMTQTDLGAKAKLSTSYVSMLERAVRSPPLETLGDIAKALGVTPCALLES